MGALQVIFRNDGQKKRANMLSVGKWNANDADFAD